MYVAIGSSKCACEIRWQADITDSAERGCSAGIAVQSKSTSFWQLRSESSDVTVSVPHIPRHVNSEQ